MSDPKSEKSVVSRQLLSKYEPELVKAVNEQTKGTDGYLEVLISGTPERLSIRYLAGLKDAIANYWQGRKGKKPVVIADLSKFLESGEVSVSQLLDLTKACQAALSKVGCPGIMIVFDEFGKFLEFESRSLALMMFSQALAEQAPFILWNHDFVLLINQLNNMQGVLVSHSKMNRQKQGQFRGNTI